MHTRVIQGLFPGGRASVQPQVGPPTPIRHGPPRPAAPPAMAAAIQRRGDGNGFAVDPGVLRTIGPGVPLPDAVRGQMEQALGASFADVRIHVGPQAQSIGAIAFTAGSDLYFAPGRFQPETAEGRRLLGHELAHVVQQRQGRVRGTPGSVTVVQDAVLEAEADRAGVRAASSGVRVQARLETPAVRPRPATRTVQRNKLIDDFLSSTGNADVAYVSWDTDGGAGSLIHRTEPEAGNTLAGHVQMYLTVYDFAEPNKGYKDIHAGPGNSVVFISKTHDTLLNMGDPRRAFHYFATYQAQTNSTARPIIRSFEIPRELYARVTGTAISESQRSQLGRKLAYNVDKQRAPNQYGFGPSIRDEIEKAGRNLVSYVEAADVAFRRLDPRNGTVLDADVLRRKLGMPITRRAYLPPIKNAHALKPSEQAAHGANLTRLYDDLTPLVAAAGTRKSNPTSFDRALMTIVGRCFKQASGYYGDEISQLVRREPLERMTETELSEFQREIAAAASFSVVEQMVGEGFDEVNVTLKGGSTPRSAWSKRQTFLNAPRDKVVEIKPTKQPPSHDEIARRKREAQARRDLNAKSKVDEEPFGNLFEKQ
jgi:hypothetical protein